MPYTVQPPEIVEMLVAWSRQAGVPWLLVSKAPDPREEQKWTLQVCCSRGTSSERDLTGEWESLLDTRSDARGKKDAARRDRTHAWNKNTHMIPTGSTYKRKNKTEEGERPRSRSRSDSFLSDVHIDGEQSEKGFKPPAAFDKKVQQETRQAETGHAVDQLMSGQTKETEEHTQLKGPSEETEEHTQLQGPIKKTEEHTQLQGPVQATKEQAPPLTW